MTETKTGGLDFDVLDENVGVQIHLTRRALWSRAGKARPQESATKPSGYMSAFIVIGANPDLSQKRLADELFLDAGAIGDIVDDLERDGLILRTRDAADRRRMQLRLTEAGRKRWLEMRQASAAHDRTVRSMLTEDEVALLIDLLKRLRVQGA